MSGPRRLSAQDADLFNEGNALRLWETLGAHPTGESGASGTHFAVWAPNASCVSVIGDWNDWKPGVHALAPLESSGLWEGFLPGVGAGARYKYSVSSRDRGHRGEKSDPCAFHAEMPPATASIVWELDYAWGDDDWMGTRAGRSALDAPQAIYEVHLGSWWRDAADPRRMPSYRELAPRLADHVAASGFTHVELLPLTEHPFYGSWGYQPSGYFAPTSRYGPPQDLMYLIDLLHQRGIGVILDWVPVHFPTDGHALGYFDGTHLYEHADPRQGFHPVWNSFLFDYGRPQVRSFLLSSALYWLEVFHADGLRVDAVASMLYLDDSRKEGEWIPNRHGGRENLEAIEFLRRLNEEVYRRHPGAQTYAEESTAWPRVSRPTDGGGLGFGFKWDMGWRHDTLAYLACDPVHRSQHQNLLSFRGMYAFQENFVLPLSHDEVADGKGSLLGQLPGDEWQRFANLRALYAYMYACPGKKLLFMGGEFGQLRGWDHEAGLDWDLLERPLHAGALRLVRDLNTTYRGERALHELDCDGAGFSWIDCHDAAQSTLSFLRHARGAREAIAVVCNFTPVPRANFRVGVPWSGYWRELLNSDAPLYGGSGQGNLGGVHATVVAAHGYARSLAITLPPLAVVWFKGERGEAE
jgi:1,4-alpha-glucan branching enzyme